MRAPEEAANPPPVMTHDDFVLWLEEIIVCVFWGLLTLNNNYEDILDLR